MIRLLSRIFHWDYDSCKGCEVLKQQLAIVNEEKKQLTDTLLSLLNPKVIELPPQHVSSITNAPPIQNFARRRAELERRDRELAKTLANSNVIGRADHESRIDKPKPTPEQIAEAESALGIESAASSRS